jgi:hypothetical protein
MNGTKTKQRDRTGSDAEAQALPPRPRMRLGAGILLVLLLVVAGVVGVGIVTIGILTRGKETKDYPSVVNLSDLWCSGVAIGLNVVLTAEHCETRIGSDVFDGTGSHLGTVAESIAACRDGLAILRIALDNGRVMRPLAPDVSDLVDGVATSVVGFGAWPLRVAFLAVGAAHDATCAGCAKPREWKTNLSEGSACKGDSGGAGFTVKGGVPRLAGIIEGGAGSIITGCASDVVLHRLDAAATTWINQSIATSSGTTIATCP